MIAFKKEMNTLYGDTKKDALRASEKSVRLYHFRLKGAKV